MRRRTRSIAWLGSHATEICGASFCDSLPHLTMMRTLFLVLLFAWLGVASLASPAGVSPERNAFAMSEFKTLITEREASLLRGSRQYEFESIPQCDPSTAQAALDRYLACSECTSGLLVLDFGGVDPEFIDDTCAAGCCGEYSLETSGTGHFIHCSDKCCSRLVSLQTVEDSTEEEVQLAIALQIMVNNEFTVTGVGQVDRCALTEGAVDGCGPQCAYLPNDPGRCAGRSTVNVPVFGQGMENSPCVGPETPATGGADGGESGSDGNSDDDSTGGAGSGESGSDGDSDGDSNGVINSDGNSDVCIDASALRHIHPNDLVFDKHSLARVLCDSNHSCSTPGHIVAFYGQAMMMKTYCAMVGYSQEMMHVNSPRFSRGVKIPSHTHELQL